MVYPPFSSGEYIPSCSSVVGIAVRTINLVNGKKIRKHLTNKSVSPEAEETDSAQEHCLHVLQSPSFGCSKYVSEQGLCAGNEVLR